MKKLIITGFVCAFIILLTASSLHSQGLDQLANRTADSIISFFNDKIDVRTSVIRFENNTGATDLVAQRFYQLVVSRLESVKGTGESQQTSNIRYTDLMVNFNDNRAVFNLNRLDRLNYLIYLKLTSNKDKIGVGISIFSRIVDRIVSIKYLESTFSPPERELFNTTRFGFSGTGFSMLVSFETESQLLDVGTFRDSDGNLRFLFYYSRNIDLYQLQNNQLSKVSTYPLKWDGTYYPTMEPEGRLSIFHGNNRIYITAGANFSSLTNVLAFEGGEFQPMSSIDFVPFRRIRLNETDYLVGGRYEPGKNFFTPKLLLASFDAFIGNQLSNNSETPYLEKSIPPYYDIDFAVSGQNGQLESIHFVDRQYDYRLMADNFEPLTQEGQKQRGSAICTLQGQWTVVSDYTQDTDTLYFYDVRQGSRQLVFQNPIDGEVLFISDGLWKSANGFWVYVRKQKTTHSDSYDYKLQFWSKKSE